MDAGIISTRYARAIYQYAVERKEETSLYEEMKLLSGFFTSVPTLRKVLEDPTISSAEKIKVLITASGSKVTDTCKHVIQMVVENGRANFMQNIALVYGKMYKKEKGMIAVKLTTVDPATKEIKKELTNIIIQNEKDSVDFITKIDPAIIGGFILEVEDFRLDASVKNQLNQLKLDLTD